MNPLLIGQVGLFLGSIGAALQWARAQKSFSDWWYYGIAAALTAFGCWLATDTVVTDWKRYLLENWPIAVTLFGAVMGGTKAASDTAKQAVAKGANEKNFLVPLTNSK